MIYKVSQTSQEFKPSYWFKREYYSLRQYLRSTVMQCTSNPETIVNFWFIIAVAKTTHILIKGQSLGLSCLSQSFLLLLLSFVSCFCQSFALSPLLVGKIHCFHFLEFWSTHILLRIYIYWYYFPHINSPFLPD